MDLSSSLINQQDGDKFDNYSIFKYLIDKFLLFIQPLK